MRKTNHLGAGDLARPPEVRHDSRRLQDGFRMSDDVGSPSWCILLGGFAKF
jgi:hypothetical protein